MVRRSVSIWIVAFAALAGGAMRGDKVTAAATDIVMYASEAATGRGHWAAAASSGAASTRSMKSADQGFSSANSPLASPANYFEMTFAADAATTYKVWLRLRAEGNSKWNDAVWVQFNDSTTTSGSAIYRIGTTSGLMVNLERCSGCGMSNWGWYNSAYWLSQQTTIRFANSGTHTIRVQTREDGVEIDQIVLSPVTYLSSAPGAVTNDTTILPKTTTTTTEPPPPPATATLSPYKGVPFALPGTIAAADFDNGGANVAYSDTTSGNSGATYRTTDVDVQAASVGGYNVGWTTAGEWLKYSVNVTAAATYNVSLRVAATAASSVQVTIGSVTGSFAITNTGGWQNWSTVTIPMTLAAGQQVATVRFATGGVNLHSIVVAPNVAPAPSPTEPSSGSGGSFRMMTWNIQHGQRKDDVFDLAGQVKFIVAQNPHVVVLQEVQTWSENQPAKLKTLLEQQTGVTWTLVWAPVTAAAGTEGNVVLTRLPVSSSSTLQLHATSDWSKIGPNRSVARATVLVGGVPVHVFSTHLDYENTSYRTAQLQDMMEWAKTFGGKRIVGGDFNSWWGEYWITTMMSEYYDTWQDVTGSNQNGYTVNNAVRFDYLFRSKIGSDKVTPTKVYVPATTMSDHNPVIADYTVVP
jgi:endonuclease/exonuclease/phosphatase family metal-dependent hydrolase